MKCSIPKGTRDFLPAEMARRNYIFDTIREVFKAFAFEPIETPSLENLSTLMGKYGEEGDKLLFKVLNSGNFMEDVDFTQDYHKVAPRICDRGLRYDLTVPFARFVVQHKLGIEVTVKINNRKVLAGIADLIGAPDKLVDITVAIDKLDKIGIDNVRAELSERGLTQEQITALNPVFELSGSANDMLQQLEVLFNGNAVGTKGVEELKELFGYIDLVQPACHVELDLTLARGLNYYTGAIFEVKAHNVSIGSICGGGRYDNLTGIFGMPDVSGVGISFGADRIYDVLTELDKFPPDLGQSAQVLFINFGAESMPYCIKCAARLRSLGISTLVYPDNAKMKKQMDFANRSRVPYVVFVGENEIAAQNLTVKDMATGTQSTFTLDELADRLKH